MNLLIFFLFRSLNYIMILCIVMDLNEKFLISYSMSGIVLGIVLE